MVREVADCLSHKQAVKLSLRDTSLTPTRVAGKGTSILKLLGSQEDSKDRLRCNPIIRTVI